MKRRLGNRAVWISATVAGLVAVAFGVLFLRSGLDASDKWASVLGIFLSLAGLSITVYGNVRARRSDPPSGDDPASRRDSTVTNTVTSTEVRGHVVQARDIHGGLSMGHRPDEPPS